MNSPIRQDLMNDHCDLVLVSSYIVFENYLNIFIFASEASYVDFKKTFGCTFLPLVNAFEFWQILGYLQYKKNHQES